MNRKQLLILLVLFVVIGGIGFYLSQRQNASWKQGTTSAGGKILPNFPLNDVSRIRIQDAHASINLVKLEDKWRVKERWDYPASFSEISDLLRKMWELKSVQSIRVGASQYGRMELIPPASGASTPSTNSGTLIQFQDKSATNITGLLLGKKAVRESPGNAGFGGGDFPVGRYVMVPDQNKVWLVSDPLTDVEPKPDRWLDKDFIKVTNLRSISVTSTNATNSWKVVRDTESGPWKLDNAKAGEEIDSSKTYSLGNALSSPSFNDVASPQAKPADYGMDRPHEATLETFDHFLYRVKIGKQTNDDNYFFNVSITGNVEKTRKPEKDEKPDDKKKKDKEFEEKVKKAEEKLAQEKSYEKWTYLVSKWTIDPLLKDRKDLLAEKKTETNAPPAKLLPGANTNAAPAFSIATNAIPRLPFPAPTNKAAVVIPPLPGQAVATNKPPPPPGATTNKPTAALPGTSTSGPGKPEPK